MLKPRIAELREAIGMTRPELATAVGLSIHSIKSYEIGDRTPRAETLWALARILGVEVEDLFVQDAPIGPCDPVLASQQ